MRQRNAACGGTAVIETAIVLPLYLLVIFGLLYFGYATLTRQRQTMAAAYSAWLPGDQRADRTLERFWPWAVNPLQPPAGVAQPGVSGATSNDHELNIIERARLNDPYYGTIIRTQLVSGANSLGGRGEDTFDLERIAVSLWNLALGKTTQRFVWQTGSGIVQQFDRTFGPYGVYLNALSASGVRQGGGFIAADESSPPQIGRYESMVSDMLNGFGSGRWLERRQATVDATYQPPFFRMVYAEADAPATRGGTYFAGRYAEPTYKPTGRMEFDVTGRGTATRLASGDDGGGRAAVLADLFALTRRAQPLADGGELDDTPLSIDPATGTTVSLKDAWRRQ